MFSFDKDDSEELCSQTTCLSHISSSFHVNLDLWQNVFLNASSVLLELNWYRVFTMRSAQRYVKVLKVTSELWKVQTYCALPRIDYKSDFDSSSILRPLFISLLISLTEKLRIVIKIGWFNFIIFHFILRFTFSRREGWEI